MSNKSFENLVNEHGQQVLRTAMRILRDASLAQDVHQEVFLSIWRRWPGYNGTVNWPAYLYRVTLRKALELAQRPAVHSVPAGAAFRLTGAVASGPEAECRADELQQKLIAAVARLPQRQADAFVLSRLERLETAEVARIMQCSEQTVRVHLHRAVMKLAQDLREYLGR